MHVTPEVRQRRIVRFHQRYHGIGQAETPEQAFMAASKHPRAGEYWALRELFDGLSCAAGVGNRFLVFSGDLQDGWAAYQAPSLTIGPAPKFLRPDDSPAPGTDGWTEYVRTAAAAGWPKECRTGLLTGAISVVTTAPKVAGRIYGILNGKLLLPDLRTVSRPARSKFSYLLGMQGLKTREVLAVAGFVRSVMAQWALPARTEADEVWDSIPADFPDKQLCLGAVDRVVVQDHAVVVPMHATPETVDDLLGLCRDDGFPWERARGYLAFWAPAELIADWDTQFGHRDPDTCGEEPG